MTVDLEVGSVGYPYEEILTQHAVEIRGVDLDAVRGLYEARRTGPLTHAPDRAYADLVLKGKESK